MPYQRRYYHCHATDVEYAKANTQTSAVPRSAATVRVINDDDNDTSVALQGRRQ
jgi:hypothetical protein